MESTDLWNSSCGLGTGEATKLFLTLAFVTLAGASSMREDHTRSPYRTKVRGLIRPNYRILGEERFY